MKKFRYALIAVLALVVGFISGALFVGHYTSRISNIDIISWDVDRMVHLSFLARGETESVIGINMKILEESITRRDYKSDYPGTKQQTALIAEWIPDIYSNLDRTMPEHVSAWVAKHKQ